MYNDARDTALRILEKLNMHDINLIDEIIKAIDRASVVFELTEDEKIHLKEDLIKSLNITMTHKSILMNHNDIEHIPWLLAKKHSIKFKYWNRYKKYLLSEKNWSPNVVNSLDDTSESIIELLEDPSVEGRKYDRRGLVVGYVQSGKTANYTAVINKAFDAGFKLIIVLAGMHNDLRSQTQMRLDEEVLGYETSKDKLKDALENQMNAIGVGKLFGENFFEVFSLTTRDQKGDFSASKAKVNIQPKVQPLLLVVKKNVSVLKSILKYFRTTSPLARLSDPNAPFKTVPNIPFLMIDDEADQASVNTAEIYDDNGELIPDYDPSKINALMRDIYNTFEQRAYVGYTATPFANIFINQYGSTNKHGEDLFPKDFIINLPKPSNYVGPSEFFLLDSEDEVSAKPPLIKEINYHEEFLPFKHKKDHEPYILPDSLVESIYAFIISTTIRKIRGQINVHNSMLIHTTRFKDVQKRVKDLVVEEVREIKNDVRLSNKLGPHYLGIRTFFEAEYNTRKLAEIRVKFPNHFDDTLDTNITWEMVEQELKATIDSIKIKEINGNSKDSLEYNDYKETGLNVIAIGGDKLSRGLTLEGLTVSYYLRASKMYDTLMQMGRWFGYRQNYLDVCRIYTTGEIISWFQHIASATEELRGQLDYMAEIKATPSEFLLKVLSHPDMYITSTLKMRSAKQIKVDYSNELIQTTVFPINSNSFHKKNYDAVLSLVSNIQKKYTTRFCKDIRVNSGKNDHHYWERVGYEHIISFLDEYQTVSSASRANSKSLSKYIEKRAEEHELLNWTVVLINVGENKNNFANLKLGEGIKRKGIESKGRIDFTSIKTLTSAGHEFYDFNDDQYKAAQEILDLEKGKRNKKAASKKARSLRDPKNGLLILYPLSHGPLDKYTFTQENKPFGFAISFPESKSENTEVDYVVNSSLAEDEEYWTELD
ncbi:Z1 domain-containing protein [Mesobacillus sp. LC4]